MLGADRQTSIYFRDPLRQLYELANYKFDPPRGVTHAGVLLEAHKLRIATGDYSIADEHITSSAT